MRSYLTLQISAAAVRTNLQLLRQQLRPGVKLCPVVKADCYGHGMKLLWDTIAPLADFLAVAAPEEAIRLRDAGYRGPLLSLFSACAYAQGAELAEAQQEMISAGVVQTLVDIDEVAPVAAAARRLGKVAEVHVKVDSGMTRSGIAPASLPAMFERIRCEPNVRLSGCCTHFAASDVADKTSARRQLELFLQSVRAAGDTSGLILHAANSAATIDLPESHLDMVRPGISVYGYQPSDQVERRLPLRPALRLVGRLLQVKEVRAGASCGYGFTYTFDRDGRVGRVPIGYGDGYLRCLSNRSLVRVRGCDAPLRGRVSMDQIIIDLTDCPRARAGDEVEIISSDPAAPHSVENLARLAGTIPYEVTCRLGGRMERKGTGAYIG
jgi:alanine racemase